MTILTVVSVERLSLHHDPPTKPLLPRHHFKPRTPRPRPIHPSSRPCPPLSRLTPQSPPRRLSCTPLPPSVHLLNLSTLPSDAPSP
eukprot:603491-Rhodomonas_salina.2